MEIVLERPIWTFIFIVVCTVTHILQYFTKLWYYLAFYPAYFLDLPWTFVTSIFLHANFEHLLFNMIALFFFGLALENMVGRKLFVTIFFLSGIVGNIGYLVTTYLVTALDPTVPAIGASGAIYGVVGTLVVLTPFRKVFLYGLFPLPLVAVVAFWVLLDVLGLFAPTGIANGAHLGGVIVGAIFGWYLRRKMVIIRYM